MAFTVKDALRLNVFKNAQLVAGHEGLDNEIRWVNILEILDELDHLHEGELLITTAFGLNNTDADYHRSIMMEFFKKKLAAVAVQTGYYLDSIPETMKELADKYRLPLIQLPPKVSFSEINRAITENLTREDLDLEFAQKVNTILTGTLLAHQGIHGIARALYKLTAHPIRILNYFYQVISCAGTDNYSEEFLMNELHSMKKNELIDLINSLSRPYEITGLTAEYIPDQVLIPIRTEGEVLGYISALKDGREFTKKDFIALTQGASLCSLDLIKEERVLKTRHNYNQEFFKELISENNISRERLNYWSKRIPLPREAVFSVCIVELNSSEWKLLKKVTNLLEVFFQQKHVTGIVSCSENEIIILLYHSPSKKPEALRSLIVEMREAIEKYFDNIKLNLGVGSTYNNIYDFKKSYEEAKRVLVCNKLSLNGSTHIFYKDMGVLRLLLEIPNTGALHSFYKDTIEPLEEYDKKHNMNLTGSLRVFLKNPNINKASRELFIHRHTLKYRLNKIQELTDLDPNLAEHQFVLKMGLLINDFLNAKNSTAAT